MSIVLVDSMQQESLSPFVSKVLIRGYSVIVQSKADLELARFSITFKLQ